MRGIRPESISAIEARFDFEARVRREIECTKAKIAHPGWVELTAGHPVPELPKLEKAKPMSVALKKPEAGARTVGLALALPEIGEKNAKPAREK